MKVFVETERLHLREILESDIQNFFELDSDPEVHKYLGNNPVTEIKEVEGMIKNIRKQYTENGIGRWAIVNKINNEFIGWSGLKYEKQLRKDFNYYDLGYRLKRKFWGSGFATEAALASLKFGFGEFKLNEIFAAAHIENDASNKILQKVGLKFVETFEYEGEVCNWYKIEKADWYK